MTIRYRNLYYQSLQHNGINILHYGTIIIGLDPLVLGKVTARRVAFWRIFFPWRRRNYYSSRHTQELRNATMNATEVPSRHPSGRARARNSERTRRRAPTSRPTCERRRASPPAQGGGRGRGQGGGRAARCEGTTRARASEVRPAAWRWRLRSGDPGHQSRSHVCRHCACYGGYMQTRTNEGEIAMPHSSLTGRSPLPAAWSRPSGSRSCAGNLSGAFS